MSTLTVGAPTQPEPSIRLHQIEIDTKNETFEPKLSRPESLTAATEQAITSDWLNATEAAEYLKVKRRTLLLWVRQGRVKAYAVTGSKRRVWRFLRKDLDAAIIQSDVLLFTSPSVRLEKRIKSQ